MCINSINLPNKNLIWKNETSLSKEEKKQRIQKLMKTIRDFALSANECQNVSVLDKDRIREVLRCNPRVEGLSIPFQLDCYFFNGVSYPYMAILRIDGKQYYFPESTADYILSLVVGGKNCRKEDPSLYSLLNGNQFERIKVLKSSPLDLSYFDEWENQKKIYREKLYPNCLSFIEKMLPSNSVVIELCGGDGELARSLFDKTNQIEKYILVDLNKKSVDKATKNLEKEIAQMKATAICDDVATVDLEKALNGKKADLIFGVGALTEQILPSKKIALNALENAVSSLKEGGYIFLTGLTSSWITSADLETLRLEVINCSFYNDTFFEVAPEFYVARKLLKAESKKSLWSFPTPDLGIAAYYRGIEH